MELYGLLRSLAEIASRHQLFNVVLSPGSRSAPLAISFLRHNKFDYYHLVDERSAAYFALGLAKKSGRPSILICTSGTAVLNYAPAIAEAFYQEIPLLVLTADRPAEWIDQNDNQAIRQTDVFGKHVHFSATLPDSFEHPDKTWHAQRLFNEAIICSKAQSGPVHINAPFREPFYPQKGQDLNLPTSPVFFERATTKVSPSPFARSTLALRAVRNSLKCCHKKVCSDRRFAHR